MGTNKISFTPEQLEEVKDDPYKLQELLQGVNYDTYEGDNTTLLFAFMYAGDMLDRLQRGEFKLSPDAQVELEHQYADIITNVYQAVDAQKLSAIELDMSIAQREQCLLPLESISDPLLKAYCTYKRADIPVSFSMEQLEKVKDDPHGLYFLLQHVGKHTTASNLVLMALLYAHEMRKKLNETEFPQIQALSILECVRLANRFFYIALSLEANVDKEQVLKIIDNIDPQQLAEIMCGKGDRVLKGSNVTIDAICYIIYLYHDGGREGCHETDLDTLNGRMIAKEEEARRFLPNEPMYQEYVFGCQCGRYELREGFFVDGKAHTTECSGHCKS